MGHTYFPDSPSPPAGDDRSDQNARRGGSAHQAPATAKRPLNKKKNKYSSKKPALEGRGNGGSSPDLGIFTQAQTAEQAPRAQARSEHQATSPLQHLPRGVTPGSRLTDGNLKRIQQLDAKHQREEAKRQRSEHNRARPRGLQAELQRDRQAAPTSAGDDDTINEDDAEFYAGFGVRLNSGRDQQRKSGTPQDSEDAEEERDHSSEEGGDQELEEGDKHTSYEENMAYARRFREKHVANRETIEHQDYDDNREGREVEFSTSPAAAAPPVTAPAPATFGMSNIQRAAGGAIPRNGIYGGKVTSMPAGLRGSSNGQATGITPYSGGNIQQVASASRGARAPAAAAARGPAAAAARGPADDHDDDEMPFNADEFHMGGHAAPAGTMGGHAAPAGTWVQATAPVVEQKVCIHVAKKDKPAVDISKYLETYLAAFYVKLNAASTRSSAPFIIQRPAKTQVSFPLTKIRLLMPEGAQRHARKLLGFNPGVMVARLPDPKITKELEDAAEYGRCLLILAQARLVATAAICGMVMARATNDEEGVPGGLDYADARKTTDGALKGAKKKYVEGGVFEMNDFEAMWDLGWSAGTQLVRDVTDRETAATVHLNEKDAEPLKRLLFSEDVFVATGCSYGFPVGRRATTSDPAEVERVKGVLAAHINVPAPASGLYAPFALAPAPAPTPAPAPSAPFVPFQSVQPAARAPVGLHRTINPTPPVPYNTISPLMQVPQRFAGLEEQRIQRLELGMQGQQAQLTQLELRIQNQHQQIMSVLLGGQGGSGGGGAAWGNPPLIMSMPIHGGAGVAGQATGEEQEDN